MVHIYSGILTIKRNTFELVLMRWMNLELIIQREVSQKEKDKYHILMHIYGLIYCIGVSLSDLVHFI